MACTPTHRAASSERRVDTENRQALRRYRHLICIEESEARIGEQVLDGGVDALVAEGRDLGARAGEAAPGQSPLGLRYGSEVLRTPSPLVGLDHQRPSVNQLDTSDTARRGPKEQRRLYRSSQHQRGDPLEPAGHPFRADRPEDGVLGRGVDPTQAMVPDQVSNARTTHPCKLRQPLHSHLYPASSPTLKRPEFGDCPGVDAA